MRTISELREIASHGNLSIERAGFIFFDIETTGLYAEKGAKIIESACVSRDTILQDWSQDAHEASDDLLVKMLPELMRHLKKGVVVGHNICFDLNFIAYKAEKLGLGGPDLFFIDTLALSRRLLEKLESHKLESLLQYFDITVKGELHTALVDVQATRAVFWKLIEKGKINTLKEAGVKRLRWAVY